MLCTPHTNKLAHSHSHNTYTIRIFENRLRINQSFAEYIGFPSLYIPDASFAQLKILDEGYAVFMYVTSFSLFFLLFFCFFFVSIFFFNHLDHMYYNLSVRLCSASFFGVNISWKMLFVVSPCAMFL